MEKKQTINEPNFEGEEMRLPTNRVVVETAEIATPRLLTAPIIVLLFLILVAILAGFYYWYMIVMSEQVVPQTTTRPTAEQNNEPESTTAEARTGDKIKVIRRIMDQRHVGLDAAPLIAKLRIDGLAGRS